MGRPPYSSGRPIFSHSSLGAPKELSSRCAAQKLRPTFSVLCDIVTCAGLCHVKGSKLECLQSGEREVVPGVGVTLCECRRFCVGRSTRVQQRSTQATSAVATRSTVIACALQNSITFNNCRNLVRGQGGGGSKSSLPDQSFQALKLHFWFSVYIEWCRKL